MAVLFLLPYLWSYVPVAYVDETLPDRVKVLDAEIEELLNDTEPYFVELYDGHVVRQTDLTFDVLESRSIIPDAENYAQNVDGIVYITIEDIFGDVYFGAGSILTEDGVILTNYHIIEGAEKVVVTTSAGDHYLANEILATDEHMDITFLKINAEGLSPIPIGDSDKMKVGDKTLVIGHPEGILNTLSIGNVSGIQYYDDIGHGKQMQITNPISGGNSGGAVLNEYGELVAVPSWSIEYEANIVQVQNLNFAVPINEALEILNR